ncbi:hypothetical protein [uncultured Roseobacter sp.]|uniref:hypothetical protein n=1 Tax=uncultured Roseobacter sp. TaxID=114847 RepID=UPI00260C7E61|nr:hypothetical protein [uncultured Roseobacter sp.]
MNSQEALSHAYSVLEEAQLQGFANTAIAMRKVIEQMQGVLSSSQTEDKPHSIDQEFECLEE